MRCGDSIREPVNHNRERAKADNTVGKVRHARYYWLLLAEGHLNRRLFGAMLRRILMLPVPAG